MFYALGTEALFRQISAVFADYGYTNVPILTMIGCHLFQIVKPRYTRHLLYTKLYKQVFSYSSFHGFGGKGNSKILAHVIFLT
jgi:hypothetical protein